MRRSLALLVTAGLLPLVALSAVFGTLTLRDQRLATENQAYAHARFAATLITGRLREDLAKIRILADAVSSGDGLEEGRARLLATRVLSAEPAWRRITIGDPDGATRVSVTSPDGAGAPVIDPVELPPTAGSGGGAIGPVVIGRGGRLAFSVSAPVIVGGQVAYVASATIGAASFQDTLRFQPLPAQWRAAVIDGSGIVVASSDPASAAVGRMANTETLQARRNGLAGPYRFRRRDGTAAAAVYVPIAGTDWTVHVSSPASIYSAPARQAFALIAGAAILCLLLFIVLARLLAAELAQVRARESAALQAQRMEALGRLTGGVAHDFNNLLTPVIGGLDLLRVRLSDDPRALRTLDGAMASAERARTLVGRLLSFSRRQTLAPRDIDLAALLEGLTDLLDRSLRPAVELRLDLPTGLPPARADPAQLELAILNLAINARDAMSQGGEVAIAAGPASGEQRQGLPFGDYVAIAVADTGTGMDEATMRHAIDPFFTTKAADKGTGLGLSMVHGFAAQSGGALRLASTPGVGTVVTIVLPQGKALEAAKERKRATDMPIPPRRILLVDDDAAVRAATAAMFEENGHVVWQAESVDEALALLGREGGIDAVVSDYLMPGRTGGDLVRQLHAERPELPVLLVTGYAGAATDLPARVPRLAKPFRAAELLAALGAAIDAAD